MDQQSPAPTRSPSTQRAPTRVSCRAECMEKPPSKCKECLRSFWDGCCLCGWCARKSKLCYKCRKCCISRGCRRFRRKCLNILRCRCCRWCCWTFTPKDYDKTFIDKPPRKLSPMKPLPKITRKEEHVEYIRRKKQRTDTVLKESENETEVYYCTIKLDGFRTNCLQRSLSTLEPDLSAIHTTGNKERKGEKNKDTPRSEKSPRKCSASEAFKREEHIASLKVEQNCSTSKTVCDFGSQFSFKSNYSLELNTHLLTKSVSEHSSLQSIFSIKWRQRFQRYDKEPKTFHVFLSNLANKFKIKKKTPDELDKSGEKKLIFLHVPKRYSTTSTFETVSTHNRIIERPLVIRDEPSFIPYKRNAYTPSNKICRPGEVLAILKLKESGRVRHVGVSNFNAEQLARVTNVSKPACLQVEVHALCQQKELIAAATELEIPVVAYSPLGSKALADSLAAKTGREYPNLLRLPAVQRIAEQHARTPAQVLLRYSLHRGLAVIPKSTNSQRIKQNISLWDFELSKEEMSELAAIDRGEDGRICDFSFFPGIEKHPEFPFKK